MQQFRGSEKLYAVVIWLKAHIRLPEFVMCILDVQYAKARGIFQNSFLAFIMYGVYIIYIE